VPCLESYEHYCISFPGAASSSLHCRPVAFELGGVAEPYELRAVRCKRNDDDLTSTPGQRSTVTLARVVYSTAQTLRCNREGWQSCSGWVRRCPVASLPVETRAGGGFITSLYVLYRILILMSLCLHEQISLRNHVPWHPRVALWLQMVSSASASILISASHRSRLTPSPSTRRRCPRGWSQSPPRLRAARGRCRPRKTLPAPL
jgi:hypothetical protein